MNRTIGERHLLLAENTRMSHRSPVEVQVKSIASTWTRPMAESSRDYCDFASAISGDDLARIAAFEPKVEPSLWADAAREGADHVRPAA